MVLRVGVGLERIGRDAEAARRRGVDAFGFKVFESSGVAGVDDVLANDLYGSIVHFACALEFRKALQAPVDDQKRRI